MSILFSAIPIDNIEMAQSKKLQNTFREKLDLNMSCDWLSKSNNVGSKGKGKSSGNDALYSSILSTDFTTIQDTSNFESIYPNENDVFFMS